MRFELVIFDCDGVLVDSEDVSDETISRLMTEIDIKISPDEVRERTKGMSDRDMWSVFESDFGRPIPIAIRRRYVRSEFRQLRATVQAIPGVSLVLEELQRGSTPVCVASSGTRAKMRITLQATRLEEYFGQNIFSADQVKNGKPAPDLFLYAAKRMGVQPARCVVVEDSRRGIVAALSGGMGVFGFTPDGSKDSFDDLGIQTFERMGTLPGLLG